VNTTSTAFRFDGTTITELPHLVPSDPISLAWGINADGVVCGYSHNALGSSQAVYWEGTALHTLPYPPDANTNADFRAYSINDHGVIVGYHWKPGAVRTACYYKDGVTYSLDSAIRAAGLTDQQSARGVNNRNVICGSADDALGIETAWTYDIETGTLTVIGKIGTDNCSATDINQSGQTIGRGKQYSYDTYRAVTFDGAWHVVDPTVNTSQWGHALNAKGRMVGDTHLGGGDYAAWYSDGPGDGSMAFLGLVGWSSLEAMGINDDDWIVGYGKSPTSGTNTHGYICIPPPGDADHDGDVDLDDYAEFPACLSGPKEAAGFVPPSPGCLKTFDFDPADGDVDAADFAAFQRAFEGS
jgi:hypothetical protein